MRVGQQVKMLLAVETTIPAGTRGTIVALETPSGRAVVEWETGDRSRVPGTRDQVMIGGMPAESRAPAD